VGVAGLPGNASGSFDVGRSLTVEDVGYVDSRAEIREFLASRRARITPE